jgi:hypothetical protein
LEAYCKLATVYPDIDVCEESNIYKIYELDFPPIPLSLDFYKIKNFPNILANLYKVEEESIVSATYIIVAVDDA